jgi:twitching motility protein PilT
MIEDFFNYAIQHNCSDIHLAAGSLPMVRLDGDILPIPNYQILAAEQVAKILDVIMVDHQKKIYQEKLETDFAITSSGGVRFRVNAFHAMNGPAISLRRISATITPLSELGLPPAISKLIALYKGLILLVGVSGSGKSTTIASMIDAINSEDSRHIITIEDPIEFVHPNKKSLVSQREIGTDTLSFDNALRSALREDPDVIMVGEMRDAETVRFVLTAAETGHLVFATLHTSSAAQTINRIIDIFPPEDKLLARTMLSTSLAAIISQKLLKKKDGGRCAAREILLATPAIRNLIRENNIPQIDSMILMGKNDGMVLMKDSIKNLAVKGLITKEVMAESIYGEG